MSTRTLALAVSALLCTLPLAAGAGSPRIVTDVLLDMSGDRAHVEADPSQWLTAELQWSALDGDQVAVRVMDDDPFQERLTWSDPFGDYISVAMARELANRAYRAQLVWSDAHGDYLPRSELEPCPDTRSARPSVALKGAF